MTEGTMRAIGQFNLTITACNITRLLRLVRLVGVAANTMAVISVYQSTDLISEINRAERKWLLQSCGSASFLFRELGAQGSEVMSFHVTRGPASSNPKGKPLSVSQRSIQSRIHCVHGVGEVVEVLLLFFFLIVFHQQFIENVVLNYLYRHLQNFITRLPALTEVAFRWDVRDGAITWPTSCPPNCWFFSQALPRRQSLTSILTAVLCLALSW